MQFYKITLFCLAVLLAFAGCTVAFDSEQEEIFPCDSDDACIDGFECRDQLCMKPITGPPAAADCIDEDGDGYGVGSDRSKCKFPELDCDDTDPNVHPNAIEMCNNVDSNCNGTIDSFECPSGAAVECGTPPEGGNDIRFACVANQCVLVHKVQTTAECRAIVASCNSDEKAFMYEAGGQSHHLVDETGELQGPIAEVCG